MGFGREERQGECRALGVAAAVNGLLVLVLGVWVFEPVLRARSYRPVPQPAMEMPSYDVSAWHAFPVQEGGRVKPFETACREAVRTVTGGTRFESNDPVAVVLMWVMLRGSSEGTRFGDWEAHPFIVCQDQALRRLIYTDLADDGLPTAEQLYGKYISPEDLRRSQTFRRLLQEGEALEDKFGDKATQHMSPEQRAASEVARRLFLFDSISQNRPPTLGGNAPIHGRGANPFHVVALDRVPGSPWFSIPELRELLANPKAWDAQMRERSADSPQLYLSQQCRDALADFQHSLAAGSAETPLTKLETLLHDRSAERVRSFRERHKGATAPLDSLLGDEAFAGFQPAEITRLRSWLQGRDKGSVSVAEMAAQLSLIFADRDSEVVARLRSRAAQARTGYRPDDMKFRMLHLDYLEALFPDLYTTQAAWQQFPRASAERVVQSFEALQAAYRGGDGQAFSSASANFFNTVADVSRDAGPYPGPDSVAGRVADLLRGAAPASAGTELLSLEMTFERVQPFRWAWVLMIGVSALAALRLATGWRAAYAAALALSLGSIGFQLFGFFCRIVLAGRPPVSNMYETVIWVAFMSSVFALALELIYRRGVILLAGSLVSAMGLVLADQLPLALDPKISPLVPVLRSNYWLTIHVLTIVSSYAAGTLAWGLGNVSLALLAFGHPGRQGLKTLSQFTYRALQIAVLLLAAGTFLGGWWAAESWGRFWGWDAKEVWALIALVCYVIPLHAKWIGWVRDFGLAVSAVLCYSGIVMAWYGVNFVLGTGLHSYGVGSGGPWWVFWAGLVNLEWVLLASLLYRAKQPADEPLAGAALQTT